MGVGDTCLLVNGTIKPTNTWSGTLGPIHPQCTELSAGPGPQTMALPWRVATSHSNGTELSFWA
eukprot:10190399-Alexandrium_andersonii.AAC.1